MSSASYDGDGLRSSETSSPGGTQSFVWNTVSSVPELIMDTTNAYIYGTSGSPVEQVNLSTGATSYLVSDSLGSVRGVVSSSGSLTSSVNYDAWGNPETAGGLTSYTPFGFAGGYTDPSGLVYLIARYYDPATGQFLSVDPVVAYTRQPFAYANEDPGNRKDPTGLSDNSCIGLLPWNGFKMCYFIDGNKQTVTAMGVQVWDYSQVALGGDVFPGFLRIKGPLSWEWQNSKIFTFVPTAYVYFVLNPDPRNRALPLKTVAPGNWCGSFWAGYNIIYGHKLGEACIVVKPNK